MTSAVRIPSASAAVGKTPQNPQVQQRNYGLLGNVIAGVAERIFEPSKATSTSRTKISDQATTALQPVHSDTLKSAGVSPLKGVKQLLRMLWSNFLPDPTFDHAIEALKNRDKQFASNFGWILQKGEAAISQQQRR